MLPSSPDAAGDVAPDPAKGRPWPFVHVWRLALGEAQDLTSTQKLVGLVLSTYMAPSGRTGPQRRHSPGRKALARGASVSVRTVEKNWPALEAAGFQVVDRGTTEQHIYVAAIPVAIAERLLSERLVREHDFGHCEQIDGGLIVSGDASRMLAEGANLLRPLANLVRPRGEARSPEVVLEEDLADASDVGPDGARTREAEQQRQRDIQEQIVRSLRSVA